MKYNVTIRYETVVEVEADSEQQAEDRAISKVVPIGFSDLYGTGTTVEEAE